MGNDSPLPVLSDRAKPLFSYFKQLFAQVTNPPIDPIREEIVMSLISLVSPNPNLLGVDETEPTPRLEVHQPILAPENMAKLKQIDKLTKRHLPLHQVIDITTPGGRRAGGPEPLLYQVCKPSRRAVGEGYNVIILSDRGVDADAPRFRRCWPARPCISTWSASACAPPAAWWSKPAPRARCITSPLLAGYGAEAIHPWLAFESIAAIAPALPASRPPTTPEELHQGHQQGPDEGDVEDGHLHLPVLLRRADFRSGRPVLRVRRIAISPARRPRSRASASRKSPRRR
jgi:glutamate synthase (NADPH/NADH) large chain